MEKAKPLDRIDRNILQLLQQDGRMANVELAKAVGLSATPCLERVRRLERDGYITGYVALANPAKLNANTVVFVQVSLTNTGTDNLREFHREMRSLKDVEACHMVAGGFDYLLKVRCVDMLDYQHFLGEKLGAIPIVAQTHTYVVIEEVKSETAIPLDYLP